MKHLTPEEVAAIVGSGQFDELIGAVEDAHLEAKSGIYPDTDRGRMELAKDVSALTNAGGGVIVIGAQTERHPAHQQDEIVSVSRFPATLVNVEQYHAIIRSWVFPPPRDIDIRWRPSAENVAEGIVTISVPPQPPEDGPFIIAHTAEADTGRLRDIVFGYAERVRGNAEPLGVRDLQRFLREGRRSADVGPKLDRILEIVEGQATREQLPLPPPGPPAAALPTPVEHFADRRREALLAAELQNGSAVVFAAIPERTLNIPRIFGGAGSPVYELLNNPPLLRDGSFQIAAGGTPVIVEGRVYRRVIREELIEVWEDGTAIAVGDGSDRLCWGTRRIPEHPLRINTLQLAETTYLFAEMTRRLFATAQEPLPPIRYVMSLHRMSAAGRRALLNPWPRRSTGFQYGMDTREAPAEDGEFSYTWLGGGPPDSGVVSYGILRRLYLWFGFNEDQVPYTVEAGGEGRVVSAERIIEDGRSGP